MAFQVKETNERDLFFLDLVSAVNEISDLSTAENTVRIDVWLYCHFIEPNRIWKQAGTLTNEELSELEFRPDFEFESALDIEAIGAPEDCYYVRERYRPYGIVSYFQRFTGTIRVDLDLRSFPFDAQRLKIRVGSMSWGSDDCTLIFNSELSDSLFDPVKGVAHLHEWEIVDMPSVKEEMVWAEADQRFISCLDVDFKLCRRTSFYVLNIFSIIFLLSVLSWWMYLIEPDVLNDRLQISITVFLALVAVNFVVVESLPRISHKTYLTTYFLLNYVSVTVGAIESGISYLVDKYAQNNEAAKIL